MDLQQQAKIIEGLRNKMKESLGQRIFVRVNLGRSRIRENTGVLAQAHPSVFICELEQKRGRISKHSFQYADILTGVVEIYQHHKPMFGPFNIEPDAPLIEPAKKALEKKRIRADRPIEQRIKLNSNQVEMLAEKLRTQTNQATRIPSIVKNREIVLELSKKYDEDMEEVKDSSKNEVPLFKNALEKAKRKEQAIDSDIDLGITFDVDENLNVSSPKYEENDVKNPKKAKSSKKKSSKRKSKKPTEEKIALSNKNAKSKKRSKEKETVVDKPKRRRGRPPKNKSK